ncbi:hypothetical protein KDZ21_07985 [Lactobacillus crispatus]|uniref:hypothetical protein n=1 Tax=Lactobacillus crispatus TaxID=47770 RepID=UPI001C4DE980|nr:hypothetical protein [Lactobacillus crispatus]MBW0444516.1 hypothetical protein [Lactobacillus crispatus]MBW0456187.1 hypothetical protein [Lactobacillus crispatus]
MAGVMFLLTLFTSMASMTTWIKKYVTQIFIGWLLLVTITYFVGILINSILLQIKLDESEENNSGLLNQHKLDMKDKEKLQQSLDLSHLILNIIKDHIPPERYRIINEKIELEKKVHEIERNANSQNNQHETDSN